MERHYITIGIFETLAYAILGVPGSGPGALTCYYITCSTLAMFLLENEFPWSGLVDVLNSLVAKYECNIFEAAFPAAEKGVWRPLPEDYILRGLDWAQGYFLGCWL